MKSSLNSMVKRVKDFLKRIFRRKDVREWECPICHSVHDRDVDVAVNIRKQGILNTIQHGLPEFKPVEIA